MRRPRRAVCDGDGQQLPVTESPRETDIAKLIGHEIAEVQRCRPNMNMNL
jgi:hypothetical protein